jgi:hypothetical protein
VTSVLILSAFLAGSIELPPPSYKAERIAMIVTAATDIITTRMAIINGRGKEGNPLLTPIVGETPSTMKLIGLKAAAIGLIEWGAAYHKRHGRHKLAKFLYHLASFSWGYASGFNLRFVFK